MNAQAGRMERSQPPDHPAPNALEIALAAMIDWIEQGKEIQDKTASATPVNKRHEALTYCLERAIDLSTTVHFAAKAALVESTATVTRALYETFLWTSWIQLSEENAATYQEVAQNELMRQARRILKTGIGVVRNKQTGKDVTEQFLQITNGLKIPSPAPIRQHGEGSRPRERPSDVLYPTIHRSARLRHHNSSQCGRRRPGGGALRSSHIRERNDEEHSQDHEQLGYFQSSHSSECDCAGLRPGGQRTAAAAMTPLGEGSPASAEPPGTGVDRAAAEHRWLPPPPFDDPLAPARTGPHNPRQKR